MKWYHWISVYMMIVAGLVFICIPEKPWWLFLGIVAMGIIGYLITAYLPLEKKDTKPPY